MTITADFEGADGAPLITVGITCFNAQETITRAVTGALSQAWPNYEILIVDDHSTDSSWHILNRLARENPTLRILRHERNLGFPGALNTLVQNARGELIAFFDDDDESIPTRLLAQYKRLMDYETKTGAELVLCYSSRNVVRVGESAIHHIARPIGHRAPEPYGPIVADYILGVPAKNSHCWGAGIFGSCTLMARRETFRRVGPFDTTFRRAAEMDFAVRAALYNAHFISVEEPLITQFKTVSTDKSVEINFEYWLRLKKKYKSHLSLRHSYLGALALHRMRVHKARGNIARVGFWTVLALICLPLRLSCQRIFSRIMRRNHA
jgi:glycosyltransferase involved in cell wall biosynthesis